MSTSINGRKDLILGLTLAIFCLLGWPRALPAAAQSGMGWSFPQRIPNYDDHSRPPFLVPDQNKTLHVFNYQPTGGQRDAIFYRRWSPEHGWTVPVDILLITQGLGGNVIQGALLDEAGYLNLVYYDESTIRYSKALATIADRAQSWSEPLVIGEQAGPLACAGFIKDQDGNLVVVYCGTEEGTGLYEIHSRDHGATWTEPAVISLIFVEERWPMSVRLMQDSHKNLHVMWSVANTVLGVGEGIYHSRLAADQVNWSYPAQIAIRDPGDYSANWASLIEEQDELMTVYQDGFPATKWMRRSQDFGQTWSMPVRLFPHEGEYEYPILLKDTRGELHLILGNRIGNPGTHGMWHSRWLNGQWSNPEPLVSGPKTPSFDPSAPKAVFLQGNLMLVTWWNDTDEENRNGAWFSFATLNLPELPAQPLPTATAQPTATLPASQITEPVAGTATPNPAWVEEPPGPDSGADLYTPSRPLVSGTAVAFLIIAVVILINRRNHRKQFPQRE